MKTPISFFLLLILMFFQATRCLADGIEGTGAELIRSCQEVLKPYGTGDATEGMRCLGMVHGVSGVSQWYDHRDHKRNVCLPEGVTTGQLVRIVQKYLNDNPQDLHLSDTYLIWFSLRQAYPCAKGVYQ